MQLPLPIDGLDTELASPSQRKSVAWRPIHYLGSKLRMLNSIRAALDKLEPTGLPVCDLFSGSGTVASGLAADRDVVAVDIQEYARVLCSALLSPGDIDPNELIEEASRSLFTSERDGLGWAAAPLIEYEVQCFERARNGELGPLCELIEAGSVVIYQFEKCRLGLSIPLEQTLRACISRLAKIGLESSRRSMAFRHFGGVYFSYKQALELDLLLDLVDCHTSNSRDTVLAAVLSTASEIVNTVGKQFAQPLRPRQKNGQPKKTLFNLASRDRSKDTFDVFIQWVKKYDDVPRTHRKHSAVRDDYARFLTKSHSEIGVVYADPPYTRDHYSRFYHVLETFCLRDNPAISTNKVNGSVHLSRGIYRQDRYQSPFCIRSQAPAAFERLFKATADRGLPLVLSYSPYSAEKNAHPRVVRIEDIADLAKRFFSETEVISAGEIFHSRLNKTSLNKGISYNAESLFLCRP